MSSASSSEFDALWKSTVRFRRVSRELEPLLRDVYASYGEDLDALRLALERLLSFLASESGRTDANCATTYHFATLTEQEWTNVADADLRAILDDMSGTLQDSVYAPQIARTFRATPEQLLERIRENRSRVPLMNTEASMATRKEVEIKSGTAGDARRASDEPELASLPMVPPETLQERQNAVRKTRRPAGPRKTQTGGAALRGEAVSSNAQPTSIDDLNQRS